MTPEQLKKLYLLQQIYKNHEPSATYDPTSSNPFGDQGGDIGPGAQWMAFMRTLAGPSSWTGGNAVGDSSAPAGFGFSMPERGSTMHSIQSAVVQALARAVPAVRASDDEAQYDALAEFGAPTKAKSIGDAISIALSAVPMLGWNVPTFAKVALSIVSLIEDTVSSQTETGSTTNPGALSGFSLGDPSLGDPAATGPLGGVGSLNGEQSGSPVGTMGTTADAAAAALGAAIADAASTMGEGASTGLGDSGGVGTGTGTGDGSAGDGSGNGSGDGSGDGDGNGDGD